MRLEVRPLDYLTALYGQCQRGHIVFVAQCRSKVSAVFTVDRLDLAAKHIEREPNELFIKVNPVDYDAVKARSPTGIGGTAEVLAIIGFHLDVDAGKNDKYLSRESLLAAIDNMPRQPSAIVETNGDTGGFHAYWWLEKPLYIDNEDQRADYQAVSNRWLHELRQFAMPGKIDGTADVCRVLRPIGSRRRKTGNHVRALRWNPSLRYTLEQFRLPELVAAAQDFERRHDGESIIEHYLDAVGENHPATLLQRYAGYSHVRGGFYIRPGSESGSPTGEVFQRADGSLGFTFKSGACDPFTSTNAKGTNGNWFSTAAIYVMLCHGNDWAVAARHCYQFFRPLEDSSWIDRMTVNGSDTRGSEVKSSHKDGRDETERPGEEAKPEPKSQSQADAVTTPAGRMLTQYMLRINEGKLPQLIRQPPALDGIEIGSELITIVGAPPGFGKTALAMQIMFDALELDGELRAVVANAETTFDGMLRRELTRRTLVNSKSIRFGRLAPQEMEQLNFAAGELIPRLQRVSVLCDPCNVLQLMRLRTQEPGLLIVDYLQKFAASDKDTRQAVNEVVATLRVLAKLGWAVLCLSATKRDTNGKHSSKELSLSSFRESGEIEYNADSAYVLIDNGAVEEECIRHVTLHHVKNRHGAKEDKQLQFHMPRMEFTAMRESATEWDGNPFHGEH